MPDAALPGRLMVVVDLEYAGSDARCLELLRVVARAAVGRPVFLQLRAHGLEPDAFRELAARARAEVPTGVPLLLNGPADLATELGFDGVHAPEGLILEQRPAGVRWLSAAVHTIEGVRRAERAGADLVAFGSVYEPGSHPGMPAGLDALRLVTMATSLPVFAIGGITADRIEGCVAAGAAGVAVISGILGAPDIERAVIEYCDALEATR